jgi:hypothetical protein
VDDAAVSSCRSCSAPIVWCWSTRRVRIPIDADPVPDGNVTVLDGLPLAEGVVVVVDGVPGLFDPPDAPHYRTHFVTCPDAERWRRIGRPDRISPGS